MSDSAVRSFVQQHDPIPRVLLTADPAYHAMVSVHAVTLACGMLVMMCRCYSYGKRACCDGGILLVRLLVLCRRHKYNPPYI